MGAMGAMEWSTCRCALTPVLPRAPSRPFFAAAERLASAAAFEKKAGAGTMRAAPSRRGGGRTRRDGAVLVVSKIREIFMPALSSTMTEGKIVSWVKSEGERLSKGESVVVVESDKADMDVETFYDGYLAAIVVREGEIAPVGSAIGLLAESEAEVHEVKSKSGGGGGSTAASIVAVSPTPPPPAPSAIVSSPPPPAPEVSAPAPASQHPAAIAGRIVATPYAKKLSKQHRVDLATVIGSGPMGRIVASDVEAVAAGKTFAGAPSSNSTIPAASAAAPAPTAPPPRSFPALAPAAAAGEPGTTVPFTSMQRGVARNMVESLTVPTFQVGYTVTTDALDALYKKIKSKGVTMTALLAKAAALALAKHPIVNAACKDGQSYTYNSSINIAVAVALDGGLLTPVLAEADKIDIYSLSRTWKELVEKARAKTLTPAEFSTGTFTVSNLGMFGVDRFNAVLPPLTGAIMAVGASRPSVVVAKGGLFGVKNQMQVNVTADHRIIYGGDVAEFLQTYAAVIEDPMELVM